jgi:hypothetical protein
MTADYSFWADALSKFHTSSILIQALWLIAVPAMLYGIVHSLCWCIRELAVIFTQRGVRVPGQMLYSVSRMEDGQMQVFGHAPELVELNRDRMQAFVQPQREGEIA